ncbi:MAG: outer membrane protein assembly factor BamA [Blastocatellia bacterium]|nr:outer membrane protein assembly factor BamA [Blastocatellia bacterium]
MFLRFVFISLVFVFLAPFVQAQILVEDIEIRGNRRLPKDTLLYSVRSKIGDPFSEEAVRRDFEAILNLGFFDPMKCRVLTADGPKGGKILVFDVREYPIIRDLKYRGLKAATESELYTKFKERRVSVTKETQYDPGRLNGAKMVLREVLAEKGHPDAKVEIEIEEINQTTIGLVFNVEEGPRIRIKEIVFTGAGDKFSNRRLKSAMKVVKESGLISSFQSKDIYFKPKLEYDLENVRQFLGAKGYLQARLMEPTVERYEKSVSSIPIFSRKGPGLRITVPVEVGRRYKIKSVKENGVTLFQPGLVAAITGLKAGEYANAETIRKGVYEKDGIKGVYGDRGYINASAELEPTFIETNEEEGEVEFTLNVDEGKQYTLRRLEFIGNNTTRDGVLRREVVINEGDAYSKRYWDLSILRLNQLGLFEEIKEKDAITRTNDRDQTVDVDLQVKERGRQSINLNGGVSGFGGSFVGLSYSTNNLLGYGKTVSFSFSGGNRQTFLSAGYTDPYLFDKPISFGVELFAQRQKYFGNSFSTFSNFINTSNLSQADLDSLFTQEVVGGTINLSSPLSALTKRFRRYSQFTRFGVTYSLSQSRVQDPKVNRDNDTSNDIPVTYSQPRIVTSRITPNIFFNTLNAAIDPTRGQSLFAGVALAGGVLGGDVKTITPSLEYKFFKPIWRRETENPHVFGMRFSAGHVRTFGRLSNALVETQSLGFVGGIPIFERYFLGGENDVRGYNVYSISPVSRYDYFRSTKNVVAKTLNSAGELEDVADGSIHPTLLRAYTFESPGNGCGEVKSANCNVERIVREDSDGKEVPFYTAVGGDTRLLMNMEYRVPIAGPVAIAAFADVGSVFNLRKYQDQIVTTNYVNQTITTNGVIVNSSGLLATRNELDSAIASSPNNLVDGLPSGFRRVYLQGDARSYNLLRISGSGNSFRDSLRASLGLEFRVQVPMLNVPFRLIMAWNPNANPDITNPKVLSLEKRTALRFSIGRTF